jgi:WD40 repeat protein
MSSLSETKRRRVEGPMHVMRGHLGEVTCCSVSPDLGLVASSSNATGILLHSLRTGRLIRRLDVDEAHAICLSSQGIILVWNGTKKTLSTFTVNGLPIANSVLLPFSGQVSCIEISTDGHFALFGTSLFNNYKCDNSTETGDHELGPNGTDDVSKNSEQSVHAPSICFVDLHTLKVNIKNFDSPSFSFVLPSPEKFLWQVFHTLKLAKGQDITAIALNKENTNLLVSTADKQLIVFTDPAVSILDSYITTNYAWWNQYIHFPRVILKKCCKNILI